MAFFEDLGNGIKNVGNSISSGAKDMSQKVQLNSEINRIRDDIDIFYRQLGEATYANAGLAEEAKTDVQPIIDNINGAFAAVKEREEAIAKIESEAQARREEEETRRRQAAEERVRASAAATCQNCGAKLLAGSKFCVQCGTPVSKAEEPVAEGTASAEQKKCPGCGTVCADDAKFCVTCGTRLSE